MTINIGIGSENSDIVNLNKIQSLANREANLTDKDFYLKTRKKAVKVKEKIDIVANEKKGILDTLVIEQKFDKLASLRQSSSASWAWNIRDPNPDASSLLNAPVPNPFHLRSEIPPKLKAPLLAAKAEDIRSFDPRTDYYTLSERIDQFLGAPVWSSSEQSPSTNSLSRTGSTLKSIEFIDPSSYYNPIKLGELFWLDYYRIELWGYSKSIHYVKAVIEYEVGVPIYFFGPGGRYPPDAPSDGNLYFESCNIKKGYGAFSFPHGLGTHLKRSGDPGIYPFVFEGRISHNYTYFFDDDNNFVTAGIPTPERVDGTILAYPNSHLSEPRIQTDFSSDRYTLDKPGNYQYVRMNRISQDKVVLYFKCKPGLSYIALADYRYNLPGRKVKVNFSYGNHANIFTPY